jgi:putative membrane protein
VPDYKEIIMMGDGLGMGMGDGYMWLVWLAFAAVFIWVVKGLFMEARGLRNQGKSPLEILQERYARGEVDQEEFMQKSKELSNGEMR